jgi:hypothetical protein
MRRQKSAWSPIEAQAARAETIVAKRRKLYRLTPEHREQLKPWAERWIANAMSTTAMTDLDRKACREAVKGLYRAANLDPPPDRRIVFVGSPFVMRFASGFAAAIWWLREREPAARTASRKAAEAAIWDGTARHPTMIAASAATAAATFKAAAAATWDATLNACWAATHAATTAATATGAATGDSNHWFRFSLRAAISIAKEFLGVEVQFGLECSGAAHRMWHGGNQWSASDGFLSFFRHVAKLDLDYSRWDHWEYLSLHSGPRIMHPKFCMISDRPEFLSVDDRNRPHCDTGPFCRWRDGSALYAVRGVRLPWWVIEHPERITVETIDQERNAEVRRVMIERYRCGDEVSGAGAFICDAGGDRLEHDEAFGTLWRREISGDEPIVMIEVVNSTPEPDGRFKHYFLRVPPGTRTAREAVAWTFGMPAEDYAPSVET